MTEEKRRCMRTVKILMALALAAAAFGAYVSGKWKATADSPNGPVDVEFTFTQDGSSVTGTANSPMGEAQMSDIQLDGDNISFTVQAGDLKILHKGTVSADEMKLKVQMGDQSFDMTAKREK